MRYVINLSYSGADFCGWQIQPSDPSVQGFLEDALGKLLGGEVQVTGAGRTDTGVNASGYIAHFDTDAAVNCQQLRYKLNAMLPKTIVVHRISEAEADFHARFGASRREYTYFLHTSKDPFVSAYSYFCPYQLDFEAMNKAASRLIGKHDFSCFEKNGADNKTSICTVFEARWVPYIPGYRQIMPLYTDGTENHSGANPAADGAPEDPSTGQAGDSGGQQWWYFRISADRFLRNMVRAIAGTLIDVGKGKRTPESISDLLDVTADPSSNLRGLAGQSVPGNALFLSHIDY